VRFHWTASSTVTELVQNLLVLREVMGEPAIKEGDWLGVGEDTTVTKEKPHRTSPEEKPPRVCLAAGESATSEGYARAATGRLRPSPTSTGRTQFRYT